MFIQTAYFIRVERRRTVLDYEIDSLLLDVPDGGIEKGEEERRDEEGREMRRETQR